MFRVSMLTLLTGAVVGVLSYAPTGAQWIQVGREQGVIPAEVPAEVTEPAIVPGAILTLIVFAVGWIVRAGYHAFGASDFRGALAGEAARQVITKEFRGVLPPDPQPADRGREIIANRSRRKELVRELAEAEAERLELVTEQIRRVKEDRELTEYQGMAEVDLGKARYELDKRTKALDDIRAKRRANEEHATEITERLAAIQAVKCELQQEQRELI